MAITEIIIPQLKKDAKSRHDFKEIWPTISQTFESLPAILNGYYGWIVNENGTDVKDDFKLILLFEWDNADSFNTFITSPDFAAFVDKSKPFAAGPTKPQLYETNLGPAGCGAAPIAEIVQMKVGSGSQSAEKAWDNLVALIEQHVDAPMRAIRGRSLNLDEEVFLGVLGWDSVESRELVRGKPGCKDGLQQLREVGELSVLLVELRPLGTPWT